MWQKESQLIRVLSKNFNLFQAALIEKKQKKRKKLKTIDAFPNTTTQSK